MRSALGRVADAVISEGIDGRGASGRSATSIPAERRASRSPEGGPLSRWGNAARRGASTCPCPGRHVLPIQGPPGTGKTYTGARMIVELVRAGKRVGVTAPAQRRSRTCSTRSPRPPSRPRSRFRWRRSRGSRWAVDGDRLSGSGHDAPAAGLRTGPPGGRRHGLAVGPRRHGSKPRRAVRRRGRPDVAGDGRRRGPAARSIVLLGDPNQLPQVSQGTHPDGAEASALEHLLGDARRSRRSAACSSTTTWRLHPEVNDFISEVFYDGRLNARRRQRSTTDRPRRADRRRTDPLHPLPHAGSGNRSPDEAEWIVEAVAGLVGRTWTDHKGQGRDLGVEDILIVAPYNAQVAAIARHAGRLGVRGNVGTVDKFQGQRPRSHLLDDDIESEVAPRGMDFLYCRQPAERRHVAGPRRRGGRRVASTPAGPCADARSDATGERAAAALSRWHPRAGDRRRARCGAGQTCWTLTLGLV